MIATVTLQTAKLLKESRFRQDTTFRWVDLSDSNEDYWAIAYKEEAMYSLCNDSNAAPTTEELLADLPEELPYKDGIIYLTIDLSFRYRVELFHPAYFEGGDIIYATENESFAESLAQMWLWLKKENLLPLKESRKT